MQRAGPPKDRPDAQHLEPSRPEGQSSATMLPTSSDTAPARGAADSRSGPPRAFASVYAPGGRRTRWAYVYVCPWCRTGHLGRARSMDQALGRHRGSCGRTVWVVVARTYAGPAERAQVPG